MTKVLDLASKMEEDISQILSRVKVFLESSENTRWVCEIEYDLENDNRKFLARPIDPGHFAHKLFFRQANRFLLQSATIVDPKRFAKELGLTDYVFLEEPSPFPLSSRPIFNLSVAKMGMKDRDASLEKICRAIDYIISCYPQQKGVIHCYDYRLQKDIMTLVKTDRFIAPLGRDRSEAIQLHNTTVKPTILLSPSMTEGVNLFQDRARFSIICKLPFPYQGDFRAQEIMKLDPGWNIYEASKTLVQAVGRGMRSEDDWCHNYVLDQAFGWFLKNAQLPKDFVNCVKSREDGISLLKRVRAKYAP